MHCSQLCLQPSTSIARSWRGLLALVLPLTALADLAAPAAAQTDADRARAAIEQLPGLGVLQIESVAKGSAAGVWNIGVPSPNVLALGFKSPPDAKGVWHAGILVDRASSYSFAGMYPWLADQVLGNASPTQLLLVCSSKKQKLAVSAFPSELRAVLKASGDAKAEIQLEHGVNLFAALAPTDQGLLGFVRHALEIQGTAGLSGQVDGGTVEHALRAFGMPNSSFKPAKGPPTSSRLSLAITLPQATPRPFAVIGDRQVLDMRVPSTRFTITESKESKSGTTSTKYEIGGSQRVSLWLLGKQVDFDSKLEVELSGAKVGDKIKVKREGSATLDWKNAFGIEGFSVKQLSLGGSLEVPEAGKLGPVGLDLGATVALPRHGDVKGSFGFTVEGKKLTEVKLALEGQDGGGIELGALPGFKRLPASDQFRMDKLAIAYDPSKKDVYLQGGATWTAREISGQAALLLMQPDSKSSERALLLFLQVDGLNLRKLVPALPPKAELLSLDRAMVAISSADFAALKAKSLPGPFKEMMAKVTGNLERDMPVFKGLTLFGRMDPASLSAEVREPLAKLGLTEPIVLAGSVGGLLDKKPSLALFADLPTLPIPKGAPSFLNLRPRLPARGRARSASLESAGARCFIRAVVAGAGPQLEVGLEGTVGVRVGRDDLLFRGQLFALLSAMDQGVRVMGQMVGEWNEPFGLKGITYRDLTIGGGVDASSSIELFLGGQAELGKLDFSVGGGVSLIAASGGLVPEKIGLLFEGSEISQLTQLQVMSAFVKAAVSGPLASAIPPGEAQRMLRQVANKDLIASVEQVIPLPLLKYRNVRVQVVTPGASFPGIDLGGMGIGIRGTMLFMNHDFGTVDNFLTLRDGLQVHGEPGEIDLGLLTLSDAVVELRVPMPGLALLGGEKAGFQLKGRAGAGCSLLAGGIDLHVRREEAAFHTTVKIAEREAGIDASVDLSKWPAFGLRGTLGDDVAREVFDVVREAAREKSQKALDKAEQIADATRAEIQRKRALRDAAIETGKAALRAEAQRKLDSIKGVLNGLAGKNKVLDKALAKVRTAANKLQVAKDEAIHGLQEIRNLLAEAKNAASKVPGKVADAVEAKLGQVRKDLDAVAAQVAAIKQKALELPAVVKAQKAADEAQGALDDFKSTLKGKVDPMVASARDFVDGFTLEQVGFDGGLDALCRNQLPRLRLKGTFAGKPFDLQSPLVLAPRGQLAARNKQNLDALVVTLFQLVDRKEADALVTKLAAGT